jgi:hypothetical protein
MLETHIVMSSLIFSIVLTLERRHSLFSRLPLVRQEWSLQSASTVGFCFPYSLTVTSGSSKRARFFLCFFGWIFAGARPGIDLESPVQKTQVFLV